MPTPKRLYRETGDDRVAVVSVTPAYAKEGHSLVRVARGPESSHLVKGGVYGPFPNEELEARVVEVVEALYQEGFDDAGLGLSLAELQSESRRRRALTALRLGWRGDRRAVEALLEAAKQASDELCAILDALGALGDPAAIPLARRYAERKLLSRRRSGVEALRNLGDGEGLAAARQRAIAGLEEPVREALALLDETDSSAVSVDQLVDAAKTLPAKRRGRVADTLYELATPATTAAARAILKTLPAHRAFVWRYLKSVFKRSTLRHDPVTFGLLAHRIERASRKTVATTAVVKSGRDGVKRETPILSRATQRYMMRAAWRYLRDVARYRPEHYTAAAAEVLTHYTHDDAATPRGRYGAFARCYLLHRILWNAGRRFELLDSSLRFRFAGKRTQAPEDEREENYPELWDSHPRPYLRLLAQARLQEVQQFAHRAIRDRHPQLLDEARLDELTAMLAAEFPPTVELALGELRRRFDPAHPDWTLLLHLAEDARSWVRALGHDWLRQTAPLWTRHLEGILSWLDAAHADVRSLAAGLATDAMTEAPPELRRRLAERLLERLREPEAQEDELQEGEPQAGELREGRHDTDARVALALVAEIDALLSLEEVLRLIEGSGDAGGSRTSDGAKTVAGAVLARRPTTFAELGTRRVMAISENEIRNVREAARALLEANVDALREDPSLLFELAESDWDDNREHALTLLRDRVGLAELGLDGLIGLCDSNRVDVQNAGRDLVLHHFTELDAGAVVRRLVEHPHRNMRRFAFELLEEHLREGAEALTDLEPFFRSIFLDLRPERELKRRAVALLTARGLRSPEEAGRAVSVLADAVRLHGVADFEMALVALARLELAHPDLCSPVSLREVST